MADKIATRQAYGEALIELVEKNDKVVVLDADLANATQTCKVAKAHPEKFYNFGIAEANMVDAAAGMSTPLVSGTVASQSAPITSENSRTVVGVIGSMMNSAAAIVRPR